MKINRMWLAAGLFSVGCGGSGGGDGIGNFDGVWNGNASLVEDTCFQYGASDPFNFGVYFSHLVNQDGAVIVLDNGASTFSGTAGEDSFSVSQDRTYTGDFASGKPCFEKITWRYEKVLRDNAQFVVRRSDVTCEDGTVRCATTFTGSAYRSGGPLIAIDSTPANGGEGATSTPTSISDTDL